MNNDGLSIIPIALLNVGGYVRRWTALSGQLSELKDTSAASVGKAEHLSVIWSELLRLIFRQSPDMFRGTSI